MDTVHQELVTFIQTKHNNKIETAKVGRFLQSQNGKNGMVTPLKQPNGTAIEQAQEAGNTLTYFKSPPRIL